MSCTQAARGGVVARRAAPAVRARRVRRAARARGGRGWAPAGGRCRAARPAAAAARCSAGVERARYWPRPCGGEGRARLTRRHGPGCGPQAAPAPHARQTRAQTTPRRHAARKRKRTVALAPANARAGSARGAHARRATTAPARERCHARWGRHTAPSQLRPPRLLLLLLLMGWPLLPRLACRLRRSCPPPLPPLPPLNNHA